jgi:hypothetical protein
LNRTIALAYGITGLAVAAALVAIIGSTTGLLGSGSDLPTTRQSLALTASAEGTAPTPRADRSEVEILQVDAPPTARGRDDDDDDDDEHSEGRREHEERGHDGREDDDD